MSYKWNIEELLTLEKQLIEALNNKKYCAKKDIIDYYLSLISEMIFILEDNKIQILTTIIIFIILIT